MANSNFCLFCGKSIGMWDKKCKHCGANQFGENNEFYPSEKNIKSTKIVLQNKPSVGLLGRIFGSSKPVFSEEECLVLGIHPDDETYRKTMELEVLSKNYK